jgi:flagellar protein FlaG
MNISFAKVPTPVSPDLPSTSNRSAPAAAASMEPVAAVQPVKAPPEPMAQKQLEAIASQLQEFLSSSDRDIEFRVDADTKAQVVTVRDAKSGEVIRQFPNADALRVLKNLAAQQGTLFNGKA